MNDKHSPNRKVLPAVWNGAVTLWNELLRGTPSETVVPSTIDEPAVSVVQRPERPRDSSVW